MVRSVLLVAAAALAAVAAPAPAVAPGPGADVVGLFLTSDGVSWVPPSGDAPVRRSLTFPATTPAAGFLVPLGHVRAPDGLDVVGNGAFAAWLTSDTAAVLTQLRVEVFVGGAPVAEGSTNHRLDGREVLLSPHTVQHVAVAVAMTGVNVPRAGVVELVVTAFGVGVHGQGDVDVLAVVGSADRPSGLTFPVSDAGDLPRVGRLSGLYVDGDGLSAVAPASEQRRRASPGADAEWVLATGVADHGFHVAADATAEVWLEPGPAGAAAQSRGVRVTLHVGERQATQSSGWTLPAPPASPAPLVVALPTAGLWAPAGTRLALTVSFPGARDASAASMYVVYGGPERATGLSLPVRDEGPTARVAPTFEPAPVLAPQAMAPRGDDPSPSTRESPGPGGAPSHPAAVPTPAALAWVAVAVAARFLKP